MNAPEKFLATSAKVDQAAIAPLPNSRKVYVQGSRSDLQVPMREISQSDTPTGFGGEKNPPILCTTAPARTQIQLLKLMFEQD